MADIQVNFDGPRGLLEPVTARLFEAERLGVPPVYACTEVSHGRYQFTIPDGDYYAPANQLEVLDGDDLLVVKAVLSVVGDVATVSDYVSVTDPVVAEEVKTTEELLREAVFDPSSATVDGVTVTQQPLKEVINALIHLQNEKAIQKPARGLRFSKIIPGGSISSQ